jgi:hypothetical protein
MDCGPDFVVAGDLRDLVAGMNGLTSEPLLDYPQIRAQIRQRDGETTNPFSKDTQVMGIRNSRRYLGDRLIRVATPHKILHPVAGPLIGVKLHILSCKTFPARRSAASRRTSTDACSAKTAAPRRRRRPRIQRSRSHLPGRLHLHRPHRRPGPRPATLTPAGQRVHRAKATSPARSRPRTTSDRG